VNRSRIENAEDDMSEARSILQTLEDGVSAKDPATVDAELRRIDIRKYPPTDLLQALSRGIERARENFKGGTFSLPDLLLAIDAYRRGTACLRELAPKDSLVEGDGRRPRIVIGVVEGDVHDLGKNIVAAVLDASGYQVHDLGRDVRNELFLEAISSTGADVLALSAMMSTPLANMRTLITMVRTMYPGVVIIVGGAALSADLALRMGADGYAENAVTVPDATRRLLGSISSERKLIDSES
jgi:methanogenic corrinoid protein MtbC1